MAHSVGKSKYFYPPFPHYESFQIEVLILSVFLMSRRMYEVNFTSEYIKAVWHTLIQSDSSSIQIQLESIKTIFIELYGYIKTRIICINT